MIYNRFDLIAMLTAACCLGASASAAPLNVVESTDFVGASESFMPSFDAGDLGVGLNSISGNMTSIPCWSRYPRA